MSDKIERQCDKCKKFKKAEFSFFTERQWICYDCKKDNIMYSVIKHIDKKPDLKYNFSSLEDYDKEDKVLVKIINIDMAPQCGVDYINLNMDCFISQDNKNDNNSKALKEALQTISQYAKTLEKNGRLNNAKNIDEVLSVLIKYNEQK